MDLAKLKEMYETQGYVVASGLLNGGDIDLLRSCVKRLTDDFAEKLLAEEKLVSGYKAEPFEQRIVSILEESGASSPSWTNCFLGRELYDLVQCPHLVDGLATLLGADVFFTGGYQLRAKQPTRYHDRLTEFPWHQDTQYYGLHTQHLHIITAWIPLVDVDEDNGCLWFVPGSHTWGAFDGKRDELQNMRSAVDVEERGIATAVPMKVGDVVFFHNLVFHSSQQNKTPLARWNVDIRFSPTPGTGQESVEAKEASVVFAQKMEKSGKPSMVVKGQGAGISYEEWRVTTKC